MGLGKLTALNFAINHKCVLIILDIRDDLQDQVGKEIKAAGKKEL
jgi:hypothetical protein